MNTIQIAHPNDIVDCRWKTVDQFEDKNDFIHHLTSPNFEMFAGLVVNAFTPTESIYTGILSEQLEWVNVSPQSNVFERYPWDYGYNGDDAKHFVSDKSWPSAWVFSQDASWMAQAAGHVLTRQQMVPPTVACVKAIMHTLDDRRKEWAQEILDFALEWADGKRTKSEVLKLNAKLVVGEGMRGMRNMPRDPTFVQRIVTACINLNEWLSIEDLEEYYNSASVIHLLCEAISEMDGRSYSYGKQQKAFSHLLRERIPFYDIAIGLTR